MSKWTAILAFSMLLFVFAIVVCPLVDLPLAAVRLANATFVLLVATTWSRAQGCVLADDATHKSKTIPTHRGIGPILAFRC